MRYSRTTELNENRRIEVLQCLRILDTPPEQPFDELAKLAAELCETPIALICLVDRTRQWFKARVGLDVAETSREIAFCSVAITQADVFTVSDAQVDERFSNNPLVIHAPHIRFYYGIPIPIAGQNVGTVCVIDKVARTLDGRQTQHLVAIAKQVTLLLESRYLGNLQKQTIERIFAKAGTIGERRASALHELASSIEHEIMNPLSVINARMHQMIRLASSGKLTTDQTLGICEQVTKSCNQISRTVKTLTSYARDEHPISVERIRVDKLIEQTLELRGEKFFARSDADQSQDVSFSVISDAGDAEVLCRPSEISQVLLNLLSNAWDAVADLPKKWVHLEARCHGQFVEFSAIDSGHGISPAQKEKIFQPFFTTKPDGKGTGIGLAVSLKILRGHESDLQIDDASANTRFFFCLGLAPINARAS